eukprot:1176413-Prorocentrum_minimum.AAC.4
MADALVMNHYAQSAAVWHRLTVGKALHESEAQTQHKIAEFVWCFKMFVCTSGLFSMSELKGESERSARLCTEAYGPLFFCGWDVDGVDPQVFRLKIAGGVSDYLCTQLS